MVELIKSVQSTPVPLLLILAGILFILLRFVTKIAGAIEVDPEQRKWTIPIGLFLLTIGLILNFFPVHPIPVPNPDDGTEPIPVQSNPNTVGSVADWQHLLNGCGYGPLEITDSMDQKTQSETKRFQKELGLPVTGKVDSLTWQAGLKHDKLPGWSNERQ
jgi:hypothetical protein